MTTGRSRRRGSAASGCQHLVAVHLRHLDVEQDQVDRALARAPPAPRARSRRTRRCGPAVRGRGRAGGGSPGCRRRRGGRRRVPLGGEVTSAGLQRARGALVCSVERGRAGARPRRGCRPAPASRVRAPARRARWRRGLAGWTSASARPGGTRRDRSRPGRARRVGDERRGRPRRRCRSARRRRRRRWWRRGRSNTVRSIASAAGAVRSPRGRRPATASRVRVGERSSAATSSSTRIGLVT